MVPHFPICASSLYLGLFVLASLAQVGGSLVELEQQNDRVISVPIHFDDNDGGYYAPVEIGTPAQALSLRLSSVSVATWVVDVNAKGACPRVGCPYGSFDIKASRTANASINDPLDAGDGKEGYYFRDIFTIDNTSIPDFRMGLINSTDVQLRSTIGLGLGETDDIHTLAHSMVAHELSNSAAYSLILGRDANTEGALLFGAVDSAKYHDPLTSLSTYYLTDFDGDIPGWKIVLSSIEATSPSGTDAIYFESPLLVTIWYNTKENRLPADMTSQLLKIVGAKIDNDLGIPTVPCRMNTSAGSFMFHFGGQFGAAINVSMSSLVVPNPEIKQGSDGEELCEFLVTGVDNTYECGLGWSFLKSAYVVLDIPNKMVGIAQAKHVPESTIKKFEGNNAPIPLASHPPNQPTRVPQRSGIASEIPIPTSFVAAPGFSITTSPGGLPSETTAPDTPLPPDPDDGQSVPGTTIGLAVGIPIAAVLCLAIAGFWLYRRHKAKHTDGTLSQGGEPEIVAQQQPPTSPQAPSKPGEMTEGYAAGQDQRFSHTTTLASPHMQQTVGELESNYAPVYRPLSSTGEQDAVVHPTTSPGAVGERKSVD